MFTQEVRNGFEMIARMAACELPAQHAGCRRFVGVYPPLPKSRIYRWRIRRFELPESLIEKYFGEEQLIDSEIFTLDTLEQVEDLLNDWGLDSAVFRASWHTDYPL